MSVITANGRFFSYSDVKKKKVRETIDWDRFNK